MALMLHDFLSGDIPDNKGRMISDILKFNQNEIESTHDYIQWIFPLREPSIFNPNAPMLIDEEEQLIIKSKKCRESIISSVNMMLKYYGSSTTWATANNHNLLRITRIIKSCSIILGMNWAQKIHEQIIERCKAIKFTPPSETEKYWRNAIRGN
jgi:hypothetical protein